MARYRFVGQGCCLTVVLLLTAVLPAAGQDIEWRVDYRRAREEARATGRPLLLDFGTEQCVWCRKLEATTFHDPNVAALLSRDFIPLRIDAARQSTLAHALKIDRYPTLVFAAPDGTILGRQVGYVDAGRFRGQMERALASVPGRTAPDQGAERAYQEAGAAIKARDYPRAIALLQQIVQGGGAGKIEREARRLLQDFENAAAIRLEQARRLPQAEARQALAEVARTFNGTVAAREATQTLTVRAR